MAEDKKGVRSQHHIILEDRRLLSITGVTDIDSFDEETVAVYTDAGELLVRGVDLHINRIDLDTGELRWRRGRLPGIYGEPVPSGGLWSRLFVRGESVGISISSQSMSFLFSCVLGMGLGVLYDVFRISGLRFPCRPPLFGW
jgi:sporulation protein YabP